MSKVEAWVTLPGLLGANKAQGGLAGSGSGCWLGGDKFRGSLGRKHDLIHSFICKYLLGLLCVWHILATETKALTEVSSLHIHLLLSGKNESSPGLRRAFARTPPTFFLLSCFTKFWKLEPH